MRVRKLTAAAIAGLVLASGVLTACDTKVGQAAIVDGHRITESQVAKYLTPNAKSVSFQSNAGATITVLPRAHVLNTIIQERAYLLLLASSKAGRPTEGDIAVATTKALAQVSPGATAQQAAEQNHVNGYTVAFDRLWVRVQILGLALRNASTQGEDVRALIDKLHFPVTVNPRYGVWDKRILALAEDPAAGVPDFLKIDGLSSAPVPAAAAPPTN